MIQKIILMRKSIRDISWLVSEETYRASSALSYSILSRFDREGFRKIGSLFDRIESPALRFGSAVDTRLTDTIEAFNNRFIVCEYPSISEAQIVIAKGLFNSFGEQYRNIELIPDEDILSFTATYQPAWGNEAKLKHIRTKCGDYYNLLALSAEKEILSQRDFEDTIACVDELKTNPYTKGFFKINPFDTRFEKVFQLKFKSKYQDIDVKCMFDEIVADHQEKIIYPIDLKTTGHPEEEFQQSFITWRYYIQAQLYTYILSQVIKNDWYFKDFKIAHYSFIVINRFTLAPLVWRYRKNFSEISFIHEGKEYRNWRSLAVELNYYLTNPTNKYTKDAIRSNGIIEINIG